MSDYLDPNNEELLKDFFAEAEQQVEQLESNILVIENDPSNHEAIDEIFRAAHTLKGGSATVEMMELSHFTHTVEDVLDEIRSDRLKVDEDVVDLLLTSIDVIKAMLEARQNGSIYEENIDSIVEKLHGYIPQKGGKATAKAAAPKAAPKPAPAPVPQPAEAAPAASANALVLPDITEDDFAELKQTCEGNQKLWCIAVKFDESNPMNTVGGIQVFAALKNVGNVLKTVPDFDALYEDQFYENVFYYVATEADGPEIEDCAFLSDVTLITDAHLLEDYTTGTAADSSVAKSVASAPVQAAPAASAPITPSDDLPAGKNMTAAQSELLSDILNDNVLKPEVKKEEKKVEPKKEAAAHAQQGSILRVDSRRIDNLLNLVSEAVINKASFNQLAMQNAAELSRFQSIEAEYKERLHNLFDKLPDYMEQIKEGVSSVDIRKSILKEYGTLSNIFDEYETEAKNISGKFRSYTQNLGTIAGDLQEGVMKIRMVPINQIFSRFPRVVRDLQRELNKKIDLVIEGEDTELDKSVVEDLLDPIMHCIRNSVDHGIEAPEARTAAGKPETGTILLKASNEGNQIVIEIKDDGAGIDVEKVRKKAVDRGLIHPDKAVTEQDAFNLIMQPGFSTADKISNISGRGVGLDVVKTMINNLKGTISINSAKGKGTSFIIKLPLTLAIIQGLLVRVGKEVYSIPIANVIESQCINISEINHIDNYEIMNVRNEVISVLRLSRLFGIPETVKSDECYIVIVGTQEKKIGVMVDALIGEEDVVIKPLKDQFTNSPGIAGASILGDGSVSLIIDVGQLLELGVKQELLAQAQENAQYAQ
ncbi:MAG: chemotaxis protein CheA [Treponema sp.]|nr:chemotaxis protein CheA [Spirochaetia bacterium]MDD7534458.1 chemotaxis protein CheA [Treponema sp.]MDY5757640.1 chemotaxis protein CheA [Treponema sp.]